MPLPLLAKVLEPGATIAFVSPSSRINERFPALMVNATTLLSNRGYKVRELYTPDTGIQSCIANRLSELRTAFTDPDVDAIICTIGGTTFTELLPALLADTALHEAIRAHPKIVIGYSDITGLHWFLHAVAGLRTFYGPGAVPELGEPAPNGEDGDTAVAFMARNLFRAIASRSPIGDVERSKFFIPGIPSYMFPGARSGLPNQERADNPGWIWLRPGRAEGRLMGGCLTVMARLAGVRAIVPDWRGRIVFFETAINDDHTGGNPIARVQAGIADLIAQGVFDEAAGLVVGRPFGYNTPEMQKKYTDVITGLLCDGPLAERNTFPILYNVDFGHTSPLVTLPYDTLATLDSDKDQFAILESAVV